MKTIKLLTIIASSVLTTITLFGAEKLFIYHMSGNVEGIPLSSLSEITFGDEGEITSFNVDNVLAEYNSEEISHLQFEGSTDVVEIRYDNDKAVIRNPLAYEGVSVLCEGARVTIRSTYAGNITYSLSGTSTDAMFKIYSDNAFCLSFNGLNITSTDGPAINIQSKEKASIELCSGTENFLLDSKTYTDVEGEDMKGCMFSEGDVSFSGDGTLTITANKKHGVCSDKTIQIDGGTFNITSKSDAFHSGEKFTLKGGVLELIGKGDAIDGDEGTIEILGGIITATITEDTTKGIKSDGNIRIENSEISFEMSGNVVVEDGDPSYSTGLKTDADLEIYNSKISINHTGEAGKCISIDGNLTISGSIINFSTSGDGATYVDVDGVTDSYSSTCIKADGNILILDGELSCLSTGSAGKGISADGEIVIGDATHIPVINVTTTGEKFFVKYESPASAPGGGGWPGGGGGMDDNIDYANPKAIKAEGNLTIHNGILTILSEKDGGEGIESKSVLSVNGGEITIETYDDAINAAEEIVFNGGKVYCFSSGNDGIDSNGTIKINGGVIITAGTTQPEGGIDCDQSNFTITGGTLIAIGGSNSTPSSSTCTQNSFIATLNSISAEQLINISNEEGVSLATFTIPMKYSQMSLLFSHALLVKSASFTISKGGNLVGDDVWHGYSETGEYTNGTIIKTFNQTSTVTTIR